MEKKTIKKKNLTKLNKKKTEKKTFQLTISFLWRFFIYIVCHYFVIFHMYFNNLAELNTSNINR